VALAKSFVDLQGVLVQLDLKVGLCHEEVTDPAIAQQQIIQLEKHNQFRTNI